MYRVIQLIFGNNFNQDITNAIPNSIIHLKFGHKFNQEIKGIIPNSVMHLTLGKEFKNIEEASLYLKRSVKMTYSLIYKKTKIDKTNILTY